jgi:hypothetical protein
VQPARAATPDDTGSGITPVSRRQTMRAIVQAGYGSADIRLVSGLHAPKNPVPGLDVAGAAGADATGFAVGSWPTCGARGPESAVTALARAVLAAGTAVRPLENHDNVTPNPRSGRLRRPRNTRPGFCHPPATGIRVM